MAIDKLNIASEILQSHQGIIAFYDSKFIATGDFSLLEISCTDKNISTERVGNTLILKLKPFITPNLIYFDELKTKFESYLADEEFSILKTNGEHCFHEANSSTLIFSNNATTNFKTTCSNLFNYFKLYNFLKSEEFADHHNDANTEIVIYSSTKGIFKIKYNSVPELNFTEDILPDTLLMIERIRLIELNRGEYRIIISRIFILVLLIT